jgi:pyridoxine 4-dehydrogenase
MLTGQIQKLDDMPANDYHKHFPRFQGENFQKNLELVEELKKLAGKRGCTAAQLALSWIKSHNGKAGMPAILPVAGARSESRVRENCKDIQLSKEELEEITLILETFPVAGGRYPAAAAKLTEY